LIDAERLSGTAHGGAAKPVVSESLAAGPKLGPIMQRTRSPKPIEELAVRGNDGLLVSLLWRRRDNALKVVVSDARLGESFEVAVGKANPLEVFYHPYAYA
jgi:hypothetical protein